MRGYGTESDIYIYIYIITGIVYCIFYWGLVLVWRILKG